MTAQRRRNGIDAVFHPIVKQTDNRGNERKVADMTVSIPARIWLFPQRSGKAEVTGQQTINVVKIGCTSDIPGVALGSRVRFNDTDWDVVTPPAYHVGARRHTRHYAMDVRERP